MLTIWHFVRCFASYFYSFISFADGVALPTSVLLHSLYVCLLSLSLSMRAFVLARVLPADAAATAAATALPASALQQAQQYLNLSSF